MTSSMRRHWRAVVATWLALGTVILAACDDRLGWDPPAYLAKIHECPQDWLTILKDEGISHFAVPDMTTDVPEFHDCQKFLIRDATQYGPLVAIFAAWELDRIFMRIDSAAGLPSTARSGTKPPSDSVRPDEPSRRTSTRPESASSAARSSPPGSSLTPTTGSTATTAKAGSGSPFGLAAALIVNLGDRYKVDDFDIRPGYSCLYLWRAGNAKWKAIILPVPDEKVCIQPLGIDSVGTNVGLKVVEDHGGGNDPAEYPPVARWDYDPVSKQQYIGIKCGAAWCEIGSKNFKPNAPYTAMTERVGRIKGWFDEQYLAITKTGTGGATPPLPSRLKGTLIPHPELGEYDSATFKNQWPVVAYVALDGDAQGLAYYKTKLNLERAPVGNLNTLNEIAICMGTKALCLPAGSTSKCTVDGSEPGDKVLWWTRITAATSRDVIYKCVRREDHSVIQPPIHIPGTARWRWLLNDETSWTRCIEGCCETDMEMN
jgi:hypothetical protein